MDWLAATPLDEVVDHAGSVTAALVGGGMVALIVSMYLALLDDGDRGSIRRRLEDATTAFRPGPAQNLNSPTAALGSVELVRALAGPAETFFRRSRAMVALLVGAVLFIGAELVPLFETALVANHCGGTIVGAEPTPSPASTAEPTAPATTDEPGGGEASPVPDLDGPAGEDGEDGEDGESAVDAKKDKNPKKTDVAGSDAPSDGGSESNVAGLGYPKVFYPPDCTDA